MSSVTFAWVLFGGYLLATTALALAGMRRTRDLAGFALGNRDMGPGLVAVTLAAATASTATFIINPGFVYASGVSALLHFGVAGMGGVIAGLVVLSKGFRRLGNAEGALTLPHWLGARYRSRAMRTYFAVLNLALAVAFVVLIVKGSALVMQQTLGLGYTPAVVLIVGFVFSYILLGGTYAHAYTNALQGAIMIVVAVALFGSGAHLFDGTFFERLRAQDPHLVAAINPASPLFGSPWDVFVCGFIVSFGLVCQPHILTKALYLESDRDVNRYLGIAAIISLLFGLILLAGLYARVLYPDAGVTQDGVMPMYIANTFTPVVGVVISVALLAAGMSTMDGVLVSASSIAANDVLLAGFGDRVMKNRSQAERQRLAFAASRYILVAMGVGALLIALDPPELVGIFAQVMVYALVAASLAPVVFGIFARDVDARDALAAAIAGPLTHFAYYGYVRYHLDDLVNPARPATAGTAVAFAILGGMPLWRRTRS